MLKTSQRRMGSISECQWGEGGERVTQVARMTWAGRGEGETQPRSEEGISVQTGKMHLGHEKGLNAVLRYLHKIQ